MEKTLKDNYDVIVVGGGTAGLAGALTLARSRRSVAVIDAGEPRNAPAEGVHGLLGLEGTPPTELLKRGRDEVRGYGGEILSGVVANVRRTEEGFHVGLADGRSAEARRVLVAAGLVDELPDIPGLREQWGRGVLHCPYCHGWEVRDRPLAVVGTGPMSLHGVHLWRQLSADVVYFPQENAEPDDEQREQFAALGVRVVPGRVAAVESEDGAVTGVRTVDGTVVPCEAVAMAPRMVARTGFLGDLGVETAEHPSGMGEHIVADAMGRTSVPGVWAAGNVADIAANVAAAASASGFAAAQINADLAKEDAARAVALRSAASA
ncbi:NAD(P)/FAD-dependent oxidoreductase [Salininema proteolyticum]|uniref:NAD(P)/FAD-dependent oxidoreductase n=1 Tax=Salininema proteolyticum TaxID=1607685 RepID=A0ABV8U2H7_9ACTN